MFSDDALPAEAAVTDGRVLLDGARLKDLRKQRGLSQESLADTCLSMQLCVSIASIKRAETGKPVLYRTARHLASAFAVDIELLLAPGLPVKSGVQPAQPAGVTVLADDEWVLIRYVLVLCLVQVLPTGSQAMVPSDEVEHLIRQFGGVPVGPGNGRVIAHFGAPLAYRSDSERGLLCALALSREYLINPGQAIVLRLMRHDRLAEHEPAVDWPLPEVHAYGSVPVYVASELFEQLAPRFEFAAVTTPQTAWRRCLRAHSVARGASRELVGRAVELLQFKAVVEATLDCQDGHLVYVRGMAGIGKTRLVAEFCEIARQSGLACHRGDVLDFGSDDVYWALGQLARSLLGFDANGQVTVLALEAARLQLRLSEQQGLFLQAVLGLHREFEAPGWFAALGNEARLQGMLGSLCELLMRVAVQQPVLVCMEDVHWGEPALFSLLARLLDATREAPVIWLLTSRPEDDPLDCALRAYSSMPMSLLDITALRPREAQALAGQFGHLSAQHRADCVQRAQGNPLYLTQLLASQEGIFPDSLRHLVQTRFDLLDPQQRRALHCACVFGNRFELARLREVLGDDDYLPAPGVRHNLLREIEPGHYAFVHDLVMHCIYDALPDSQRDRLHQQVAQVYRRRDPGLFALHLLRGRDPQAFEALLAAMQQMFQACQYENMLALGRQCEHFAAQAEGSFRLAWLRGQAFMGLGRTLEAHDHFALALQLTQVPAQQIDAALGLATALNTLDRLDEEERLLERIIVLAQDSQAWPALARLLHLHGNIYFPRGDYARCRSLHEQSLHWARLSNDQQTQARALSGIGDSYYAQGQMQTAYEVFDQCVRLCEKHALVHVEAGNRSARASAQLYLGRAAQALGDAEDAVAISQRIGNHRAEVFSRLTLAWSLLVTGQEHTAEQQLQIALQQARSLGASRFEALVLEGLARVALHRGQRERAQELIEQAVQHVRALQLQRFIGPWVYASLALIVSDETASRAALAEGLAQLEQGCLAHNALRFRVTAAEVCLLGERYSEASQHAKALEQLAGSAPCAWISHHVALIDAAGRSLQQPGTNSHELDRLLQQASDLGLMATMPRLTARLVRD